MKKITLVFTFLFALHLNYAQDTCASAVTVATGTTNVGTINGTAPTDICGSINGPGQTAGEWYTFTATVDGEVNITTNLPQNDGLLYSDDTRIIVYTGTCGALVCLAENDDISVSNYLSDVTFPVSNGTTYTFVWDDRWSSQGFDFVLTETAVSCLTPNTFVANDITSDSLDLEWSDANTGTPTWEIEWGLAGFTQGAGTMVTGIATPNYVIMGTTADTNYEFYIRTSCGGGDYSEWVGPLAWLSGYDCSLFGTNFTEDWANPNSFLTCFEVEDANTDGLSWTMNTANDLDGNGTIDNIVNIFPQTPGVAKDDWLFSPAISGTANADYEITVVYNSVNINGTANESFELRITDTPSAAATSQTLLNTYTNITQSGTFQGLGGNDLITQAYSSTETYTASADGDFHVAIHANTNAINSDVFFILSISVNETLGVDDFQNRFANITCVDRIVTISQLQGDANYRIFSITGQVVQEGSTRLETQDVSVETLSSGIYIVEVSDADSNAVTRKKIAI